MGHGVFSWGELKIPVRVYVHLNSEVLGLTNLSNEFHVLCLSHL